MPSKVQAAEILSLMRRQSQFFYQSLRPQQWRCELTALSQTCNLYFVGCGEYILVFQPSFPYQELFEPALILHPPPSRPGLRGYINRRRPHFFNRLHIDFLGRKEVLLAACDDGDVVVYYVSKIQDAVDDRCTCPGVEETVVGTEDEPGNTTPTMTLPVARVPIFYQTNMGQSAWGLAVHRQSRRIAISANTKKVRVISFPLTTKPQETRPTIVSFSNEQNTPSISFNNTGFDPEGNWLLASEISGAVRHWDLDHPNEPFLTTHVGQCLTGAPLTGPCGCGDYSHGIWGSFFIDERTCYMVSGGKLFFSQAEYPAVWEFPALEPDETPKPSAENDIEVVVEDVLDDTSDEDETDPTGLDTVDQTAILDNWEIATPLDLQASGNVSDENDLTGVDAAVQLADQPLGMALSDASDAPILSEVPTFLNRSGHSPLRESGVSRLMSHPTLNGVNIHVWLTMKTNGPYQRALRSLELILIPRGGVVKTHGYFLKYTYERPGGLPPVLHPGGGGLPLYDLVLARARKQFSDRGAPHHDDSEQYLHGIVSDILESFINEYVFSTAPVSGIARVDALAQLMQWLDGHDTGKDVPWEQTKVKEMNRERSLRLFNQRSNPVVVIAKGEVYLLQPKTALPVIAIPQPLMVDALYSVTMNHDAERQCFSHYISELGILLVGSPLTGRCAIFSITVSHKSEGAPDVIYGLREEYLLPLPGQLNPSRIYPFRIQLVGVACGPVQGCLFNPDDCGIDPVDGIRSMRRPRLHRLFLYYSDHTVLSYEISINRSPGEPVLAGVPT